MIRRFILFVEDAGTPITSTGTVEAQPAQLSGSVTVDSASAAGELNAEPATLSGTATVGIAASGAVTAAAATLEGVLSATVTVVVGTGVLRAEPAELTGTLTVTLPAAPGPPYRWPWLKFVVDGVDVSQFVAVRSANTSNAAGGRSTASFTLLEFPGAASVPADAIDYPDVWTDTYTILQDDERIWFTTFYVAGLPTITVNGVSKIVAELSDVGSTPGWEFYYIRNSPGISHNQSLTALAIGDVITITYPVSVPDFGLSASPRYGGAKRVEIYHRPTGHLEFGGVIDSSTSELSSGIRGFVTTQINCVGYGVLLDRRVVGAVFPEADYGTVESIAAELVATYFDGTGVTYDGHAVSPNVVGTMVFNWDKGGDALRKLCDAAGCDFFVDQNLQLKLVSGEKVGTGAAPFSIEQNDGNWRRLVRTDVNTRFWNSVVIRTSRNVDPVRSETFTATGAESYTTDAPFENLVGGVHVTVDGIERTDYSIDRQGITFTDDPPLSGEIIITSVPDIDSVATAEDAASIAVVGLVQHVREIRDVPDRDALQAIADAVLEEGLDVTPDLTIHTDRPGLQPGQALPVNANGVDETVLVQQVDMSDSDQGYPRFIVRTSGRPKRKPLTQAEALNRMLQNSKTGVDRVTMEMRAKIAETIVGQENPGVTFAVGEEQGAFGIAVKPGFARRAVLGFREGAGCKIDMMKNGVSIFQAGGITWSGGGPVFTSLFNGAPLLIEIGDTFTLEVRTEDPTARDGYMALEYM
jgi:hypothetical protein